MKITELAEFSNDEALARWLLSPEAIRARCGEVFAAAETGELEHFVLQRAQLDACADYVVETIRQNYPDLEIPFHARWRHFRLDGEDIWSNLAARQDWQGLEKARVAFDLAVTSVLLDAGAGPEWSYVDQTGQTVRRSEGLAIASLEAFQNGVFSSDPENPCRADAGALKAFTPAKLARAFQVTADNPLAGPEGRAGLMQSLGAALADQPDVFGVEARLGNLVDTFAGAGSLVPARDILIRVLESFGSIWSGRTAIGDLNLGDTWYHPAISASDGLVPFHKLSQWLSYSLIEPLEEAGIKVSGIDDLTGLAEYRNGGLFMDSGVLEPRSPDLLTVPQSPGNEAIVEWRALTIILLDEVADLVRSRLQLDKKGFPLAKVLEGGTWAAGRRIALNKRSSGGPPVVIESDGSVF